LGLVIVGAVAGGLIWRSRRQRSQADDELRTAVVERGAIDVVVSASGSIRPVRQVDLTFETGGQVIEVPVEIGDQVQEGDLLVGLDRERLNLQVDQAETSVALAEAQLAKLKAGAAPDEIEASEANVRSAAAQADAAAAERDQVASGAGQADIAAAEAEVASALTQQKKANDFYEQTLKCFTIERSAGDVIDIGGGQVITLTEDFKRTICPLLGVPEEQARYRLEAADEALEAARARLDQTKAGADQDQLSAAQSNVAAAAARRDAAQAQLDLLLEGATSEQIAAAEASVEQAQASLRQAELAMKQAVLEAPFDGTIAAVDVTVGQQATPGLPAVTLVDLSQFHVTIAVDELDVAQLAVGQPARLTFDALPNTVVTGTVKQIAEASALSEGVVTYDVRIDLAPSDAPVRVDMTTSATIIVEEISDTLKIPTWAVHIDRGTGQYYVRRRTGDEIERVDVELGVRQEGVAQVLDGLSAGDEVVRSPESAQFDFESGFGE
jgi:HlyD family secretion protein